MLSRTELHKLWRNLLVDGVAPFWLRHGLDTEHGGVLSCMTEDGRMLSGDKYIWSQARSVWTFSALYNRIERDPRFLEAARNSIRFLLAHGRNLDGRWVYRTTREGRVLDGPISIYSDAFAVYGFSEYCRAIPDEQLLRVARETLQSARARFEAPGFRETAPQILPPGRKTHGVPMIFLEVAGEYAQTTGETWAETLADECAARIMNCFVRPQRRLLLEFLTDTYEELPPPEGTAVTPGHAIESMWFVLHWARWRGNAAIIARAAEVIRWHLEAGWDPVYGGLFLNIDAEGHPPFLPLPEVKAWWPHTEALYALLLAWELTGERWCLEWYERMHEWSFSHFSMPEVGEWRQRLYRSGEPMTEVIALPVKDPFHLPRAATLIVQLLEQPGRDF
jgi:N-acylglucosamine 2-epimerase